jgi:hypothetical protein
VPAIDQPRRLNKTAVLALWGGALGLECTYAGVSAASATPGRHRDSGESFVRVHWVAVPEAVRARRVNRRRRAGHGIGGAVLARYRRANPCRTAPLIGPLWLRFTYVMPLLVQNY